MTDRDRLLEFIREIAVVRGRVTLSSGLESDWYIDLRRITLHHEAAPLVGRVMLDLVADWDFVAVGGPTMGADPVASAMLHASGGGLDAFVVRKQGKAHGMKRQVEGPEVSGRRVLVVEDTSTTGGSPLGAVDVVRAAGAEVVGVALIVDRGARDAVTAAGLDFRAAYDVTDLGV
ncbi:MAG: orotate phosphoribosyltransferase [Geodermatophilaceae bacterium]|nr:orotate phosphoribosyltransferase [Geodermatophilaceae bacterium]MDQ3455658.1 orotate phosphoribosyltransferase [Actinomycetota bacterium]